VAAGEAGIVTSINGTNWVNAPLPLATNEDRFCSTVCCGNGTFLAAGAGGLILTSSDGLHWVERNVGTMNDLSGAVWGQGGFIVVGASGTIMQSAQAASSPLSLSPIWALPDGNVALAASGPASGSWQIQASTNLLDWTLLASFQGTNGLLQFIDFGATNYTRRFYRGQAWQSSPTFRKAVGSDLNGAGTEDAGRGPAARPVRPRF